MMNTAGDCVKMRVHSLGEVGDNRIWRALRARLTMGYHQRLHFVLQMSPVVLGQDQHEEPGAMELIRFG